MARLFRLPRPTIVLAAAGLSFPPAPATLEAQPAGALEVYEADIFQLQRAMDEGRITSVELVSAYVARIRAYDQDGPQINSILLLNPRARAQAAALDAERLERGPRGPLHGIPVLLKDNIDTADLATSAGSFALAGTIPPDDAFVVQRLRQAGAVILGKTNMHELAVGITTVSSVDGQTRNPYDPARNPGGSSGGTGAAVTASFAALGWGTDTCGSLRIPAAFNSLFGLRPTRGLISTDGIIPLSHTQDIVGPMARTVTDLAVGLDAVLWPARDEDTAPGGQEPRPPRFLEALDEGALRGARIGVLDYFLQPIVYPEDLLAADPRDLRINSDDIGPAMLAAWRDQAELTREEVAIVRGAVDGMRALGARIVPISTPRLDSLMHGTDVVDYEFKFALRAYLEATPAAPVASLGDILDRGLYHPSLEWTLRKRNEASPDSEAYRTALARGEAVREAVLRLMDAQDLDALAYPTMRRRPALIGGPQNGSTCQLSAATGFPALTMPAGLDAGGLPVGVELLGRPMDDARLVGLAYAYEQARRPRRPPPATPPLVAPGGGGS